MTRFVSLFLSSMICFPAGNIESCHGAPCQPEAGAEPKVPEFNGTNLSMLQYAAVAAP